MPKQIDQHKHAKLILHDRDKGDKKEGWSGTRYLLEIKDTDGKDRGIVGEDVNTLISTAKASIDLRRMRADKQPFTPSEEAYIFGIPSTLPGVPLHWEAYPRENDWLTAKSPDNQLWLAGTDLVWYGVTRHENGFELTGEVMVHD
jgi:hypothetical protein